MSEWFGGAGGDSSTGSAERDSGEEHGSGRQGKPRASLSILLEKRDPQTWVGQDRVEKVADLGLKGAFFPMEEKNVIFRIGWTVGLTAMDI